LALKNIAVRSIRSLAQLQHALNLSAYPSVIECFDISNLGYDYVVGGMVQWIDGQENKAEFRKFEIKSKVGMQDDFNAMKEVVYRRYKRLHHENKPFPHLIIIDGGPGQLSASLDALNELGLKIPIISLAKQEEEIYIPNESTPLKFEQNSDMMLLVRSIRDSVHRFVLSYNKKKRQMRLREDSEN
jgi:excinuclease ABC subunit C